MAVSQERLMRANPTTTHALARIIPFRRKEPLQEPPASAEMMLAPKKESTLTGRQLDSAQSIKLESARESKAKGGFRKALELPNEHYVVAWIVWYRYVAIMLSSGLRVEENVKRLEYNQPLKRAA